MPGTSPFHFIAPQLTYTFVIEPIQHGSGGETGRLYSRDYSRKYLKNALDGIISDVGHE